MRLTDRLPAPTRRRLRVLAWRARRPLAALCAGLAVLLAVERLRPPDPPAVEVTVAARDLPAGTVLADDDVAVVAVPVALVPAGVPTDAAGVLGHRTAVGVPAGLPLASELLAEEAAAPPEGSVVVPVRFADAGVAALLRPGMRVDVVAAALLDGAEAERLARDALVLAGADAVPEAGAGSPGGPLGGSGGAAGAGGGAAQDVPVLLAVSPAESVTLGAAAAARVLGAVIVG